MGITMNAIKVLDVTLRDGGCVNQFNFGQAYMEEILNALEESGVDYIELGYIDQEAGSEQGRTQYINEAVIEQHFLTHKKPGVTYVAMMDYGKFDVSTLQPRSEQGIDGIRVAFHKKDRFHMVAVGKAIMEKGYEFYVQPMITMRYTDKELLELIELVNTQLPEASGFYIVDSFGEMRANDLIRVLNLVDYNLIPTMTIGFHSHNNLQLSYSNAMSMLEFSTNRTIMLDSSVMGMGKGAGNLNTELLLEHLNLYYNKTYNISPLLKLIDQVIGVIHKEFYWGYSVEYYLSSVYHCTPSYAGHFYNKHMLPVNQVAQLLGMIAREKKISFDKAYAEELYLNYNAMKSYDDSTTITRLRKELTGKRALIIAPGKRISEKEAQIRSLIELENVVSISLNHFKFTTDFVFTTREEAFQEAVRRGVHTIVPSHIFREEGESIYVLDYQSWIITGENAYDSSGVMVLNLLLKMGVKEILLAGFDGFSVNINDNYYDMCLRKPVLEEQATERNKFYKSFLSKISEEIPVTFLTESLYEKNA